MVVSSVILAPFMLQCGTLEDLYLPKVSVSS